MNIGTMVSHAWQTSIDTRTKGQGTEARLQGQGHSRKGTEAREAIEVRAYTARAYGQGHNGKGFMDIGTRVSAVRVSSGPANIDTRSYRPGHKGNGTGARAQRQGNR